MIELDVKEYCHNCMDFKADVVEPIREYFGEYESPVTSTVVRCEYRKRCANIVRYLERQIREKPLA